jgi:hypothetical protein
MLGARNGARARPVDHYADAVDLFAGNLYRVQKRCT